MRKIIKPFGKDCSVVGFILEDGHDEKSKINLDLTNCCVYDHFELAGTISFTFPPMDIDDLTELFQDGICGLIDHIYGGCNG